MRLRLLIVLLTGFLLACSGQKKFSQSAVIPGIQMAPLSAAGLDAAIINKMDSLIEDGTYPNIHSVLIVKEGKLMFEKYYTGQDENWGKKLGSINHNKDSLHDIRSVTKSIVSSCVGLALAQGKIKSVDQKVFDFFPEYKYLDTGIKSKLTIRHLLTMSSGLVWNEDVPYSDTANSEIRMVRSADPIVFVLSQPMEQAPGEKWKYNGGATQLLASIIERTTGKKIDAFANEYLFQPLGINRYEWNRYSRMDLPAAASGLRLTSRDMLKFALLFLKEGQFGGKQVLPAAWVKESVDYHIQRPGAGATTKKAGYGYQFWLWSGTIKNKPADLFFANGNGGQHIFIDKKYDLIIVTTAGNYNKWDIQNNAARLIDFVYEAMIR